MMLGYEFRQDVEGKKRLNRIKYKMAAKEGIPE